MVEDYVSIYIIGWEDCYSGEYSSGISNGDCFLTLEEAKKELKKIKEGCIADNLDNGVNIHNRMQESENEIFIDYGCNDYEKYTIYERRMRLC